MEHRPVELMRAASASSAPGMMWPAQHEQPAHGLVEAVFQWIVSTFRDGVSIAWIGYVPGLVTLAADAQPAIHSH